jgi:hypothetical protein
MKGKAPYFSPKWNSGMRVASSAEINNIHTYCYQLDVARRVTPWLALNLSLPGASLIRNCRASTDAASHLKRVILHHVTRINLLGHKPIVNMSLCATSPIYICCRVPELQADCKHVTLATLSICICLRIVRTTSLSTSLPSCNETMIQAYRKDVTLCHITHVYLSPCSVTTS